MIFNSLILHENSSSNGHSNSNKEAIASKGKVLSDIEPGIADPQNTNKNEEEKLTFNQFLERAAGKADSGSTSIKADTLTEHGNQFPFIDTGIENDFETEVKTPAHIEISADFNIEEETEIRIPLDVVEESTKNTEVNNVNDITTVNDSDKSKLILGISEINTVDEAVNNPNISVLTNEKIEKQSLLQGTPIKLEITKIISKLPIEKRVSFDVLGTERKGTLPFNVISEPTNKPLAEQKIAESERLINVSSFNVELPKIAKDLNLNDKPLVNLEVSDHGKTLNLNNNSLASLEVSKNVKSEDLVNNPLDTLEVLKNTKSLNFIENSHVNINKIKMAKNSTFGAESSGIESSTSIDGLSSDINKLTQLSQFNTMVNSPVEQSLPTENTLFKHPLNTNGQFTNDLGIRIQWMLQQALSSAEVMLDPPELGPLNVKLMQAGSETNIVFQVQTPQGKEAIEDNLSKLKEMLLSQGINLGETEVQHKQSGDQSDAENQTANNQTNESELTEEQATKGIIQTHSKISLLDTYI